MTATGSQALASISIWFHLADLLSGTLEMAARYVGPFFAMHEFDPTDVVAWPILGKEVHGERCAQILFLRPRTP